MACLVEAAKVNSPIEALSSPELALPSHEPSAILIPQSPVENSQHTEVQGVPSVEESPISIPETEAETVSQITNTQALSLKGENPTELETVTSNLGVSENHHSELSASSALSCEQLPIVSSSELNYKPNNWSATVFATNNFFKSKTPRSKQRLQRTCGLASASDQDPTTIQDSSSLSRLTSRGREEDGGASNTISVQSSTIAGTVTSSISSIFSPASASILSPTSLASSRTSLDVDIVTVVKDSEKIYCWCEERSIYVGKLKELRVPPAMEIEWRENVRIRLLSDLRMVLQSLPRSLPRKETMIEPELCMAGELQARDSLVELRPTILIRCGGKKCRKEVTRAVDKLEYLRAFSKGRIQVHHKAPKLASGSSTRDIYGNHSQQNAAESIGVQLQNDDIQSACGIKARFTLRTDDINCYSLSNVGGLIRVDGIVYGLTTAHAIIDLLDQLPDSDSESITNSDIHSGSESEITPELPLLEQQSQRNTRLRSESAAPSTTSSVRAQLPSWSDATLGPWSCAGKSLPKGSNAYAVSEGSDFALIHMAKSYSDLRNVYCPRDTLNNGTLSRSIDNFAEDAEGGPVSIVCSSTDIRCGCLLNGDALFMDRCNVFSTRKLQTDHPLEPGLSGTWVARGSNLVGMIIAVYEDEPYPHMIPISRIFSDVRALLSSGDSIPKVQLYVMQTPVQNSSLEDDNDEKMEDLYHTRQAQSVEAHEREEGREPGQKAHKRAETAAKTALNDVPNVSNEP